MERFAGADSPVHSLSVGKWRSSLSDSDRAEIKDEASELLIELGYAESNDW